jgi:diazepam-binding inhibitor (GABA receptor modulating acyl-CoA-binding protein)
MSKNSDLKLEAEFTSACEEIKKAQSLDNETLLSLYGLYKQALEGDCNVSKPNFFDLKGTAKWDAWNENKSMDKATAMRRYVRKVNKIMHP